MNISKKIKTWIRYLVLPITWHIIYLIVSGKFDKEHRVYCDLIFYLGIAAYFISIDFISFKDLCNEWKKGKEFWKPVLYTIVALIMAFGIGLLVSSLFPNIDDGMGTFRVVNLPTLLAFVLTTVILPPIAEEAFYRKGILNFDNNISLFATAIIGIFLYASEHSLRPLGFVIATIWALPLTISYIKTKNVYIPMTAHFICNLGFNGITVIMIAMKFLGV